MPPSSGILSSAVVGSARGLLTARVPSSTCSLAAEAPDTRVVFFAEVTLSSLTAEAPDLCVE